MTFISIDGYEPKHLSFSTVSTYRMCGKKTYLEKVLMLEQRPGLSGMGGSAFHTATEEIDRLIHEHGLDILREDGLPADPTF